MTIIGRTTDNAGTAFHPLLPLPRERVDIETAFRLVAEQLPAVRPVTPENCWVLAAVSVVSGNVCLVQVGSSGGLPVDVVVGRHSGCDLILGEDPSVALRHALVRFSSREQFGMRVRILELDSSLGLRDERGAPVKGLVADGSTYLRIGRYHLFASPLTAFEGEQADYPPRRVHGACFLDIQPIPRRPLRLRPRLRLVGVGHTSETRFWQIEGRICSTTLAEHGDDAIGSIILVGPERDVCARLTTNDLRRGVLVGRYERCQVALGEAFGCLEVSRVHLCLLLDEDGLWAIDLASTNGTTVDGQQGRTAMLGRTADIRLGAVQLRWCAA